MAFDGIVVANVVKELRDTILGGRINKIAQPEKDELIITIKGQGRESFKLFLSAGAGLPLIYLTETNKPSPLTAPNFCMLLRKHLNSARILDIAQPGLERIINFKIEHMDELGDLKIKYLIIELMGKHSNIIFCDESMKIIDSIKRINHFVSSVREVLPGRDYFIPDTTEKLDPLTSSYQEFKDTVLTKPMAIGKGIYSSLTGISPQMANEICTRASLDANLAMASLSETTGIHLFRTFERLIEEVKEGSFTPHIILSEGAPVEFAVFPMMSYEGYETKPYETISSMLEAYYATKNTLTRNRQKSADLRKLVANAIERTSKKYDLQIKQLKDTDKRDKYKIYGELLTTYGYNLEPGAKVLECLNYYNNEEIAIPLDPTLTAMENAKHYFDKYSKLKRTYVALTKLITETKDELTHLESIRTSLDIASDEHDLAELKRELMEFGYIKKKALEQNRGNKKGNPKKVSSKSKPLHYISSDGFHMYVGKNNYQNDELTFNFAEGGDWWFHAKNMPGSHVIVKTGGAELPDRAYEEAASLAAYYSGAVGADKVEIDYTLRKNVKKPGGGKPGFVVYYSNYSLISGSNISGLTQVE